MTQHYDIVSSLKAMAAARHDDLSVASEAADHIERLQAHIELLRNALAPFANLPLFPDNLGEDNARHVRCNYNWSELENDQKAALECLPGSGSLVSDDFIIKRGHIRAARNAMKGM